MKVRTQNGKCYMMYKGGYVKEENGTYQIRLLFPNGSSLLGGEYNTLAECVTILEELDRSDNSYKKHTYYLPER